MNRINDNTQYYLAQEKAYEVLLKYTNGTLPICPFAIIKKIPNIKLVTYTDFARDLQKKYPKLTIEEIIDTFESKHGFLKKKGKKKYVLAYNEKDKIPIHIWTLFHELGHYFLGHLLEKEDSLGLSPKKTKNIFEKEANCFARHCSSPVPLMKKVMDITGFDDTKHLHYLMFKMGDKVIEYSSQHFEKFSHCYDVEKYRQLINKFGKEIKKICNYISETHVIDYEI